MTNPDASAGLNSLSVSRAFGSTETTASEPSVLPAKHSWASTATVEFFQFMDDHFNLSTSLRRKPAIRHNRRILNASGADGRSSLMASRIKVVGSMLLR